MNEKLKLGLQLTSQDLNWLATAYMILSLHNCSVWLCNSMGPGRGLVGAHLQNKKWGPGVDGVNLLLIGPRALTFPSPKIYRQLSLS